MTYTLVGGADTNDEAFPAEAQRLLLVSSDN